MKQHFNKPFWAILIFLFIFFIVYYHQFYLFFNQDGSIRQFGIGYKNKTILPLWLFSFILGIISYLSVIYFNYYFIHFI